MEKVMMLKDDGGYDHYSETNLPAEVRVMQVRPCLSGNDLYMVNGEDLDKALGNPGLFDDGTLWPFYASSFESTNC